MAFRVPHAEPDAGGKHVTGANAPGYRARRELGSGVGSPTVRPGITNTGIGEAIEAGADKAQRAFAHIAAQNANSASIEAVSRFNVDAEQAFIDARQNAEPGAANFTPDLLKKFDAGIEKIATGLPDELTRKTFRDRIAASRDNFANRSLQWEAGERQRFRVDNFSKAAEADANQLFAADSASRSSLYASQGATFDQALEAAEMEPGAKQALRDEARNRRSYAAVQADLRDRPDDVQDWVVGRGAGEGGYYAKLRAVESGGRNIGSDTSSAFGPYQFTKGTWSSVIAAHPELNLTEADRFKPQAQEIAIRAFTQDNIKTLKSAGIEATPVNVYMAHFLGSAGAVRFLKANPGELAANVVLPESRDANAGVFKPGRTVGDVLALFGKKFGPPATRVTPTYYADLAPEKRDALYSQAETEMNKRRVQGEAAFKQRVDNSLAEYATAGNSTASPTEAEFVAALGVNRGTVAYGEFAAKAAGATAGYKLLSMPPSQIPEFVESQRPTPGDPFYAEKSRTFAAVTEAAAKLAEQQRNDPAAVVIRRFPQAGIDLRDALNPDTEDAPAKLDAWVQLANANGSERILPNAIRDQWNRVLSRVPDTQVDATALWSDFSRQRALWGKHWPTVLRELGEPLSDVRVIGSGISEEAATILLTHRKNSFGELTKILPPGSGPLIDGELQDRFGDYARSLRLPGEDGSAFFAAAQKLTAVRMRDGVSASTAADWAYDELIGKKYAFEGDARIPRSQEDVAARLDDARADALKAADLSHLPAGVSRSDAERWHATTARWVTLPDDSGVILMEGSKAVRDTGGKAIFRNWSELRSLPQAPTAPNLGRVDTVNADRTGTGICGSILDR